MNKSYSRLLKDTTLFAISGFGSKILSFLLVPVYTSVLSTGEYGTADLIVTTVNLLCPLLTLSMSEAVLRFAFDSSLQRNKVLSNGLVFIVGSTVFLFAIYPFCGLIDSSGFQTYWLLFVLIYLFKNLTECFTGYLKAIGKTKLVAIQGIIYTVVYLLCNILFLLIFKIGVNGYLLSMIIAGAVSVVIMIFFGNLWKDILGFSLDISLLEEMAKFSLPLVISTVSWWVNTSADKYMISNMVSISENGIYSVAHKIPTLLTMATGIFSQAWNISVINSEEHDDKVSKFAFYSEVYEKYIIIGLCTSLAIIPIGKNLSRLLFANDFYTAWKYIPFLLLASLFSAYSGFFAAMFRAGKKTKIMFTSTLISAIINIILNYFLIKNMGAMGAALATMVSFSVMWIIRSISIQKVVDIEYNSMKLTSGHLLLTAVAFAFAFDVGYRFYIFTAATAIICIMYGKEILDIFRIIIYLIKKTFFIKHERS